MAHVINIIRTSCISMNSHQCKWVLAIFQPNPLSCSFHMSFNQVNSKTEHVATGCGGCGCQCTMKIDLLSCSTIFRILCSRSFSIVIFLHRWRLQQFADVKSESLRHHLCLAAGKALQHLSSRSYGANANLSWSCDSSQCFVAEGYKECLQL